MSDPRQGKPPAPPRLSCELCRDRKVKCDKLDPCTNCLAAGVACVPVQRLRLPRGRHTAHRVRRTTLPSPALSPGQAETRGVGETNAELKDRIRNLESLVQSMSTARSTAPSSKTTAHDGWKREEEGPDRFWENLVKEVEQIRDIVALSPGEADDELVQAPGPSQPALPGGGLAPLGLSGSTPSSELSYSPTYPHLDREFTRQACEIYLRQVDPIVKILHRPSLKRWLIDGEQYLDYTDRNPSTDALCAAVCYSAAISMTEEQCLTVFQTTKPAMVAECRRACESAIEHSGLLTTRDITVLQAFVLYLAVRQTEERNRAVWTLLATAVRIARALHLHMSPRDGGETTPKFFKQQMQTRLWLTICVIDLQTSISQAFQPLIPAEEVETSLALLRHINDTDFDPTTLIAPPNKEGITDVTFALVKFNLQVLGRQIGAGRNLPSSTAGLQLDSTTTQQYTQKFEKAVLPLLYFCDPESSSYAWLVWHSTHLYISGARLVLSRPMYRTKEKGQVVAPPVGSDTEVLELTVRALEKMEMVHKDPRADPYRWMVSVQWHILAVAIAECYVCTDKSLVSHAWNLIESLYGRYEKILARNGGTPLQGPLGRLMRRTREKLTGSSFRSPPIEDGAIIQNTNFSAPTAMLSSLTVNSSDAPGLPSRDLGGATKNAQFLETPPAEEPALSMPTNSFASNDTTWNASWDMWDEFMYDISYEELNQPDLLV